MGLLERLFEGALWRSRYVVLFAVIASMAAGFAIFYMATVDVYYLIAHILHYADPDLAAEIGAPPSGRCDSTSALLPGGHLQWRAAIHRSDST